MGTCVSKCYPSSAAGSGSSLCSSPAAAKPAAASCNAVAVHPLPLPLPAGPSTSSSMAGSSSSSSSSMDGSSSSSSTTASSSTPSLPCLLNRDSLSVEWEVVVLNPNKKKPMRPHHPGRRGPAATSKRPRSVSPLTATHHAIAKKTVPIADAQAWKKKKVMALDQRRRHRVPPPSPPPHPQVRRNSRVPEDDLTNPLISMDCFIFL